MRRHRCVTQRERGEEHERPGTDEPGPEDGTAHVARDLHARFQGVFGQETIETLVLDSFQRAGGEATVTRWLVVGTERFARAAPGSSRPSRGPLAEEGPGRLVPVCSQRRAVPDGARLVHPFRRGPCRSLGPAAPNPDPRSIKDVVAAMAEIGIDISREFPKPWTDEFLGAADVVVTMGCGDACPLVARQTLRGLGARRPRWGSQSPRSDPSETRSAGG